MACKEEKNRTILKLLERKKIMNEHLIREIPANPELKGLATYFPHVVYSRVEGEELPLEIMAPAGGRDRLPPGMPPAPPKKRFPLIVFLQGSGWLSPDFTAEFVQLAQFARSGFVVASIGAHRNIMKGQKAPAYLIDSKTAIRFLRAHADDYCIDPERVCFWGTSSGGNTAQLIAVTGDNPAYKTDEYGEYSDSVQCAVSCFGPSDMEKMFARRPGPIDKQLEFMEEWRSRMRDAFIGKDGDPAILAEMSPIRRLEKGKPYPPLLLAHGTDDVVVLCEQSENMLHAYREAGGDAELILVPGANHEGEFWSPAILDAIQEFITRKLQAF